jgi:hypothetical protein
MAEGVPLSELRDGLRPDGALDRIKVSLLGLPIELNAYIDILGVLGVGGYRDQLLGTSAAVDYGGLHFTCFQFDYDWRRDLVESARRLGDTIDEAARIAQQASGSADPPRVDVVAHSMGGLILHYYLRYGTQDLPERGGLPELTWEGAAKVEHVVMVGTPNAGSVKALQQLVEGFKVGPFLPTYEPALIGTMPAVYQLLPRTRHAAVIDGASGEPIESLYDASLWEAMGWGLADRRQERVVADLLPEVTDAAARRRIALDHVAKCLERARRVHEALDVPADPPRHMRLHLIAGDAEPTAAVVSVDRRTGRLRVVARGPGDGTVSRASALMDERQGMPWSPRLRSPIAWSGVTFLFRDHLGLTKDPAFADNVLYLLLEKPRQWPAGPGLASR